MFRVGELAVYPMHGVGHVQAIEEEEALGVKNVYYVLQFDGEEMRVMLPVERAEESGLRPLASKEQAEEVLQFLRRTPFGEEFCGNWNRRYRSNMEKLKTGHIFSIAEVVHSLSAREARRGLSYGEKRMLENARKHLVGELCLAKGVLRQQMEEEVEAALRK